MFFSTSLWVLLVLCLFSFLFLSIPHTTSNPVRLSGIPLHCLAYTNISAWMKNPPRMPKTMRIFQRLLCPFLGRVVNPGQYYVVMYSYILQLKNQMLDRFLHMTIYVFLPCCQPHILLNIGVFFFSFLSLTQPAELLILNVTKFLFRFAQLNTF